MSRQTEPDDRRRPTLAALSTNLLPVVGVVLLDWSLLALLLVYWVDLGANLAFAALRGAIAGRPPEHDTGLLLVGAFGHRRGGVSVPFTSLSVQVANLPVLLVALPVFGAVWLFVGGVAVGAVGESVAGGTLPDGAALTVGLGVVAVVVGRGLETLVEYMLPRRDTEVSVGRALRTALWPLLVVGTAMLATGFATAVGAPPTLVLVAVVLAKAAFDLAAVYRDRLVAFDETDQVDLGFASEAPEWPSLDPVLDGPVDVVRSRPAAVVVDGVARGLRAGACLWLTAVGVAFALLGLGTGAPSLVGLAAQGIGLVVGTFALVGVLDGAVRHWALAYRVGDDVVAHDRLLDRAQWRASAGAVASAERRCDRVDRLFGTETLVVDLGNRTVRVPHVPPESALGSRGAGDDPGS